MLHRGHQHVVNGWIVSWDPVVMWADEATPLISCKTQATLPGTALLDASEILIQLHLRGASGEAAVKSYIFIKSLPVIIFMSCKFSSIAQQSGLSKCLWLQ